MVSRAVTCEALPENWITLIDLGINAIYLNPIFKAHSNHRYDTVDYYQIDPRLGSLQDFDHLVNSAHPRGVRVILDGVFNHCGRGFFGFTDLLENGDHSEYLDWFHIKRFPLDAYSPGKAENYLGWWDHKSLPKFNTSNQYVREYLFRVAEHWIHQGADGWRLDVPNEIDDDSFWAEFRQRVKSVNPQAYLLGEIWTQDRRWVGDGHFDGLMNYPLREAVLDLLNGEASKASDFTERIDDLLSFYPRENTYSMFLPLGSHDTERIYTLLGGDVHKVKLAYAFYFAFPGAPAVYYGDEIGTPGGKDPECRAAFPWDGKGWLTELRAWVKHLAGLRSRHTALRQGDFRRLVVDDECRCYAFARSVCGDRGEGDETIAVVINPSAKPVSVRLNSELLGWDEGFGVTDLLSDAGWGVHDQVVSLDLAPWSTIYLTRR